MQTDNQATHSLLDLWMQCIEDAPVEIGTILRHFLFRADEEKVISLIQQYTAKNGSQSINDINRNIPILNKSGGVYFLSFFTFVTLKNTQKFIKHFLSYSEFDIEKGSSPFNESPLLIACKFANQSMAKYLIDAGANLLHQQRDGNSILMTITSLEIFRFILAEAERKGCLDALLALKNNKDNTVYESAGELFPAAIMQLLLRARDCTQFIKVKDLLHHFRTLYWKYPDKHKHYDEVCTIIKHHVRIDKKVPTETIESIDQNANKIETIYQILFDEILPDVANSEEQAMKKAIAQFSHLLSKPDKCMPYLAFLNSEFKRYYFETHKKHFASLDSDTYGFDIIDCTYYPFPKLNFKSVETNFRSLKEFLVSFFKNSKMGSKTLQWIGFIPHNIADEHIKNFYFVMESYFTALLHNELSHMIQLAILILALNKKISTEFIQDGQKRNITIKDIIKGLVTIKKHDEEENVWIYVMDERCLNAITFNDPYRLASFIMQQGNAFGLNALADSMIGSFCKKLLKQMNVYKQTSPAFDMDIKTFFSKWNDNETALFDTPSYLLKFSLYKEHKKGNLTKEDLDKNYAVIEKEYHPNQNFIHKNFS